MSNCKIILKFESIFLKIMFIVKIYVVVLLYIHLLRCLLSCRYINKNIAIIITNNYINFTSYLFL